MINLRKILVAGHGRRLAEPILPVMSCSVGAIGVAIGRNPPNFSEITHNEPVGFIYEGHPCPNCMDIFKSIEADSTYPTYSPASYYDSSTNPTIHYNSSVAAVNQGEEPIISDLDENPEATAQQEEQEILEEDMSPSDNEMDG